jgi:hypothetical protein
LVFFPFFLFPLALVHLDHGLIGGDVLISLLFPFIKGKAMGRSKQACGVAELSLGEGEQMGRSSAEQSREQWKRYQYLRHAD